MACVQNVHRWLTHLRQSLAEVLTTLALLCFFHFIMKIIQEYTKISIQ